MIPVLADPEGNSRTAANTLNVMCNIQDVVQEPVKPITFAGFKCCINLQYYQNTGVDGSKRIAIILEDPDDGEIVATATINVPTEILKENEVIIKDYSENEGMLSTLILAKVISVPVKYTQEGAFPICKLLLPWPRS